MIDGYKLNRTLLSLFASLALPLLGGCSTPYPTAALSEVNQSVEYKLAAGDDLRILVYGEEKISGEYHVSSQGVVSVPMIGDVNAEGLSLPQLRDAIAAAFEKSGVLTKANVSVDLLSYRPFYVLGEVNSPGQYPYSPKMNVLQAIATAKGYTYRARHNVVFITHWGETKETGFTLTPGAAVLPGDTIRIPERHF